eukprot:Skav201226  [mRNA]  locus=scaffold651:694579:695053:- [translate_table: standard]
MLLRGCPGARLGPARPGACWELRLHSVSQQEQQIAIRYDDFKHKARHAQTIVQGADKAPGVMHARPRDSDHILVELRDVGYIEVSGLEASASAARAVHELFG